jgi:hypothetical protein
VCDQETSNEGAKARYGAVENTTKRVVTPRKQTTTLIRCACVSLHIYKIAVKYDITLGRFNIWNPLICRKNYASGAKTIASIPRM